MFAVFCLLDLHFLIFAGRLSVKGDCPVWPLATPPAKVTPAAWTPEESTRPAVGIAPDARPTTEDLEEEGIHRSASRPSDDSRPDTMLKRAFRSVKNGLRRLGGFMIVRGAQPPGDQRIPASFMPSRS